MNEDQNNTQSAAQPSPRPKLNIASDDTLEKFQSKMTEVRIQEREVETEKIAGTAGYPYIDLRAFPITKEALTLIPQAQAEKQKIVCFFYNQEQLRLGTTDSKNPHVEELLHQLQERHHTEGKIYLISEESYKKSIESYKRFPVVVAVQKGVTISEDDLKKFESAITSLAVLKEQINKVTVTDLVTLVIAAALNLGTSDIHIEAAKENVVVRFRLDGVLQDIAEIEKEKWDKIASRIKLVSALKINIKDKPQDGRFTIRLKDGEVDVRVSTLPTVFGESVVMRILKSQTKIEIESLGFSEKAQKILMQAISMPHGMIITTGPTGSGKTTTLYAILQNLNKPDVKIITLEDPVEYKMKGINQSQIDPTKDFTFAGGLRAMLRQDPDIAMVGEIRDFETADTAINAALTGHLMLSTIHTNSAAGAIPRFLAMGVKPFLLAPSLRAVIGQRLVRKLCPDCKKEIIIETTQLGRLKNIFEETAPGVEVPQFESIQFFGPGGCEKCDNIGYKGRIGIYEIFEMTPVLAEEIGKEHVSEHIIQSTAIKNGMVTMGQDGVLKAISGLTSLDEVLRAAE